MALTRSSPEGSLRAYYRGKTLAQLLRNSIYNGRFPHAMTHPVTVARGTARLKLSLKPESAGSCRSARSMGVYATGTAMLLAVEVEDESTTLLAAFLRGILSTSLSCLAP